MRSIIVGIVIGSVIGVMVGTTVIAPRLNTAGQTPADAPPVRPPAQLAEAAPATALPPAAPERPVTRWRMASAFPSSLPVLGDLATRLGRRLWRISDGGMELRLFEPGTLVPAPDLFEAVASGTVDAAFSSPAMWSGREPALHLLSSLPFGPPPREYLAWTYSGGGLGFWDDLYHPLGVHGIPCGLIGPMPTGWFKRPFNNTDDLKGLNIRASGLGARVLETLGMRTHGLDDADVFFALESGAIDAAEFSLPAIDLKLGLHQLAGHYYFPGWSRPASFYELLINKDKWDSLGKAKRSQIIAACGDNVRHGLAESEAAQYRALKELTKRGTTLQRLPGAVIDRLETAWRQVATEQAAADAKFRRVYESLREFRANYAIWDELARP